MKFLLIAWAAALVFTGVVVNSANGLSAKVKQRSVVMQKSVDSASTFRERINRMRPVEKEFANTLPFTEDAKDAFAIYNMLGLTDGVLVGAAERTVVSTVTEIKQNDKSIGVASICINSGSGAFVLRTEDLDAALPKLRELLAKPWIVASEVFIEATPGRKTVFVNINGLCAYMRTTA